MLQSMGLQGVEHYWATEQHMEMLDKKQIWMTFLFEFKLGQKQQRQLTPSTMHLAQELLMNRQCSGGSRSFSKEISLKDEEHSGLLSEVNNDQLRGSSRLILLQLQEVAQELNINHSTVIRHFKQTEKVKSMISGCLMSRPQIEKIII